MYIYPHEIPIESRINPTTSHIDPIQIRFLDASFQVFLNGPRPARQVTLLTALRGHHIVRGKLAGAGEVPLE